MRRLSKGTAVMCALVVVAETVLIGYWIATGAAVIVIGLELLVVAAVSLVALTVRYRKIGHALHEATIAEAAARERTRIATDMHDTLGHELSLIALRAGALQVIEPDAVAKAAAQIRRDADHATARLHDIIEMLRSDDTASVDAVIDRARDAGADVRVHGSPRGHGHHVYLVVREALTNAMRHAPGAVVSIEFGDESVCIRNPLVQEVGQPRGLLTLGERIRAAGGTFEARPAAGEFVVTASVPHGLVATAQPIPRRRYPTRVLLRQAIIPAAVAAVVVVGFYVAASNGVVMEQSTFDAVAVGATAESVDDALPGREARVRLVHTDPHPESWRCRYYTDGNFPLALATYEICTDNDIVTRTTDLRRRSWS